MALHRKTRSRRGEKSAAIASKTDFADKTTGGNRREGVRAAMGGIR